MTISSGSGSVPLSVSGVDFGTVNLTADPFENFERWLTEAEGEKLHEPTAMTLATASRDGRPSARIVLFKGFAKRAVDGRQGFRLFTNYESRKSQDLEQNPRAALVFFWAKTEAHPQRQVRVEGRVERLNEAESNAYFQSRARGSRLGAWASPQSQKIESREELLKRVRDVEFRFGKEETSGAVPRPENWGGWLLIPERIEFWQGGEFRLHDRFLFEIAARGEWAVSRLAP